MNNALWVIQVLLALVFVLPGWGKIGSSVSQHIADGHIKPGESVWPIRMLGVLEWLGCIGILLPWWTGIAPVLTPVAAVGFCLIMVAGMITHYRRKEYRMLPMLLLIFSLAAVVAFYRFKAL